MRLVDLINVMGSNQLFRVHSSNSANQLQLSNEVLLKHLALDKLTCFALNAEVSNVNISDFEEEVIVIWIC
ncbi:hypothetical protein MHB65_22245 [Lysinibacillus sp. FSL K6-0075]|uniref:hypothetical protein n=1 Tax=Lysinibacillus sp. FSL K6-0075 TaxID=2921415 RepID=UPI0031587E75